MPLSLSRRKFLSAIAAGAGWLAIRPSFAADADPHRLALLADTHIPDVVTARGPHDCDMTERMRSVVREITAQSPRPMAAVINGDLAWKTGTEGEYARFAKEIEPVIKVSMPLYLSLGNHDAFDKFHAGVKASPALAKPVDGKHVMAIELPRAELVILDSLEPRLGGVAGECGKLQLKWLDEVLDRNRNKPAIVFVHHHLQTPKPNEELIGLSDSAGLWDVLKSKPRVKALISGHTHSWKISNKDGIHLVHLPAVGYPFDPKGVSGWVDMQVTEKAATLTVHAIDQKHSTHLQKTELGWR